ncbi:MAG: DUF2461 domain-containing protein [Armatimonadota bacterium]
MTHFRPGFFRFLTELKAHNTRAWFEDNRERYERDVKGPMLRFIDDFAKPLRSISPNFSADSRPVGGSMFRIHRDIRFSKDKSPYKTNVGAHFPHLKGGRDARAPGFYLHLAPGKSFGGGGLRHPDAEALRMVRQRIVQRQAEWRRVRQAGVAIEGEALKRVPAGYDTGHPFAEDLKLKGFYAMTAFTDRDVCSPFFMQRFLAACRAASPLVAFLTRSVSLPW